MTEGKAVLLGFLAVAAAMVAVPVFACVAMVRNEPQPPGPSDAALVKAFLASKPGTETPITVTGIDQILPAGLPQADAIRLINANGFTCGQASTEIICTRSVRWASGLGWWHRHLTFDSRSLLRSSVGLSRSTFL